MSVEDTLKQRGNRYGEFKGHSILAQGMKNVLRSSPKYHLLDHSKTEAIEMILHKIARIVNGDPEYKDNWHDIQGYAKLAEDLCEEHSYT